MHAITISRFGDPDVLTEAELPDPRPGPGQIAIDVTHAAVGMIDVIFRRGDHADDDRFPPPPFVPGIEVAGLVRELGAGVEQFRVGERVVTLSLVELGGYATVALADAARTVSLEGVDVETDQALASLPNAVTAHLALTHAVSIRGGETVLVHGATGGLAAAFPAVARALGAERLIGTVVADAHVEAALALGHDKVIRGDQFPDGLDGEQVAIIVDPVGGELRKASLDVLAPEGRLLIMGHASPNPDQPFTGDDLWGRSVGATGFVVGTFLQTDPTRAQPALDAVSPLVADGTISVPIQTLALAQAAEAHRHLEARTNTGRLILATG
ncbi:quinone oxidoreductase family protein [Conexibacter woesei]|uniref:quinone oxidoreductase family protein n=1 Tax=Conexibacter woesei TaxID=191495 RepID=UPI0004086560|nr:zinc-binding dehydrogenase [Conexibacter woesei]